MSRMIDIRTPSSRLPMPRRGREDREDREDRAWRPFHRSYESVEQDFDEVPLDDLRRQADAGGIDVADL